MNQENLETNETNETDADQPIIPAFAGNYEPILDNDVLTLDLKPVRMGENAINWHQSLFAGALMSAVAQQCSREAANELFNLRQGLFSEDEIVEDTCPPMSTCFENYVLKEGIANTKTEAQVNNMERRWAEYNAIVMVAVDLDNSWRKFYVNSTARRDTAPQYGLRPNPRFMEGRTSEPRFEPILSFEDAVRHYYKSSSRVQAMINRHHARKDQVERMNALTELPADERVSALGF